MAHDQDSRLYNVLAVAAARLSNDGKKQEDIARQLGTTQPEVSRLLRHAEKQDWLRLKPLFQGPRVPPDLLQQADERFFSYPELQEKLAKWPPRNIRCGARVVHTQDLQLFSRAAAERLAELIVADPEVEMVGVLWGKTIDEVVKQLVGRFEKPPRKETPLRFVPVCGEPIFLENLQNLEYSASALAARLESALNGKPTEKGPSLAGVPAYLSTRFTPAEVQAIRKYISGIPGYEAIFGSGKKKTGAPGRLVDGLDAIITGIGVIDQNPHYSGTLIRERLAQENIEESKLARWVLGDIGGILIPRPDLKPPLVKQVEKLNAGLTGIQYEDFQAVAARSDKPGVILIASGPAKAKMLHEVVKQGLVRQLIIDRAVADELMKFD